MEDPKIVKKPRKPRTKKPEPEPEVVEKVEEPPKEPEIYAGPVILAVDPAFKKCGFGIISLDKGEYIESF